MRTQSGDGGVAHAPDNLRKSWKESWYINLPNQPDLKLTTTDDYRENYANSVQVRVSVWDFFLVFGTLQQSSEHEVEMRNFQGIYLSPQQAKALMSILQQNVNNYEKAFGEIKLDPNFAPGPVN